MLSPDNPMKAVRSHGEGLCSALVGDLPEVFLDDFWPIRRISFTSVIPFERMELLHYAHVPFWIISGAFRYVQSSHVRFFL